MRACFREPSTKTKNKRHRRQCIKNKCQSKRKLSHLTDILDTELPHAFHARPETRHALSLVNGVPCPRSPPQLMSLAALLSEGPEQEENKMEYGSLWKGCHSAALFQFIYGSIPSERKPEPEVVTSAPLHLACIISNPLPLVEKLLAQGTPVNSSNQLGQTPLHSLVLGDSLCEYFSDVFQCLLSNGASLSSQDKWGNTPLLSVGALLKKQCYHKASHIVRLLLQEGSDVQHQNFKGHTLLVYSVQCLDSSYEITQYLLNNGASVWGVDSLGYTSAFLCLMKTIMENRKFANCQNTLHLICQLMHPQPLKMKNHVLQSVNRLSKCYEVYGGLLLKIRNQMHNYWDKPPSLSGICRHVIRRSIPPSSMEKTVNKLNIPPQIKSFLLFDAHAL